MYVEQSIMPQGAIYFMLSTSTVITVNKSTVRIMEK